MNWSVGKLINGWKDISSGPAGRMEVAGIDWEGAQWNSLEGCKVVYGGRDLGYTGACICQNMKQSSSDLNF